MHRQRVTNVPRAGVDHRHVRIENLQTFGWSGADDADVQEGEVEVRDAAAPQLLCELLVTRLQVAGGCSGHERSAHKLERTLIIRVADLGGRSLSAAQIDPRMKAVATVSMYDMGRDRRQGLGDMSEADRRKALEDIAQQRWAEAEGGKKKYVIGTPETISAHSPAVAREFYDYYRTPRGHHPRSTTAMSPISNGALMQFCPMRRSSP
ncbi:MAG: hypothetical protein ACRD26_12275 [Vicinamibacterales bacterium]